MKHLALVASLTGILVGYVIHTPTQASIQPTYVAGVYSHSDEGMIRKHYLFENGDYCQELSAYGFVGTWAGRWQLQNQGNDTLLNITQKSFFNTLFPAWFNKDKTVTSPQIVINTPNFTQISYYGSQGCNNCYFILYQASLSTLPCQIKLVGVNKCVFLLKYVGCIIFSKTVPLSLLW